LTPLQRKQQNMCWRGMWCSTVVERVHMREFMTKGSALLSVVAALALLTALFTPSAKADTFTINIIQSGANVVATGSGSIDISTLTFAGDVLGANPLVCGSCSGYGSAAQLGPGTATTTWYSYSGLSGPTSFGTGTSIYIASASSGDLVGIWTDTTFLNPAAPEILVSESYTSGSVLSPFGYGHLGQHDDRCTRSNPWNVHLYV